MEKIKKNVVISSLLIQLNKHKIGVKEVIEYSKNINKKLKGTKYSVDILDEQSIYTFFNHFPVFGKIKNDIIELSHDANHKNKIKKFFLSEIDEDILLLLKKNEKVIFPIITNNQLTNYYLSIDSNELLDSVKDELYYDNDKQERYLLDLETVSKKIGRDNINYFLETILNNSTFEKKETFKCTTILEYIEYVDGLSELKFKNLEYNLNVLENVSNLSLTANNLFNYYNVGGNNQVVLSQVSNSHIKKLTKN